MVFRHPDERTSATHQAHWLQRDLPVNKTPALRLERRRKQMPSQGFPREGFGCRRSRQKSTITLEAMSVAELPTADPLTRGRAVACQLLTKQRRLPDDVGGAGLRCRRCGLRLRHSNA